VLFGRGAGIHEQEKIFGMSIEPEKEVVLTVVYGDQADTVLQEIVRAAELNDTDRGIAFVLPVDQVVGVAHFMRDAGEGLIVRTVSPDGFILIDAETSRVQRASAAGNWMVGPPSSWSLRRPGGCELSGSVRPSIA